MNHGRTASSRPSSASPPAGTVRRTGAVASRPDEPSLPAAGESGPSVSATRWGVMSSDHVGAGPVVATSHGRSRDRPSAKSASSRPTCVRRTGRPVEPHRAAGVGLLAGRCRRAATAWPRRRRRRPAAARGRRRRRRPGRRAGPPATAPEVRGGPGGSSRRAWRSVRAVLVTSSSASSDAYHQRHSWTRPTRPRAAPTAATPPGRRPAPRRRAGRARRTGRGTTGAATAPRPRATWPCVTWVWNPPSIHAVVVTDRSSGVHAEPVRRM